MRSLDFFLLGFFDPSNFGCLVKQSCYLLLSIKP